MKQRFTSLLLARIRQLICATPNPPLPEITGSEAAGFSLDTDALIKAMNDDLAALQAEMEETDKAMKEADAVMQQMLDEWNDPTLSDESRALLQELIETSIRQLTNIRVQAMEDLESMHREFLLGESTPPGEIAEPGAARPQRPTKRHYLSTFDHRSLVNRSPVEQRADCSRGS